MGREFSLRCCEEARIALRRKICRSENVFCFTLTPSLRMFLPVGSRVPRLRCAFEMRVVILAHQKARLGRTSGLALLYYPAGPTGPLLSASCCSGCFFSHFPCVATRCFPGSASCPARLRRKRSQPSAPYRERGRVVFRTETASRRGPCCPLLPGTPNPAVVSKTPKSPRTPALRGCPFLTIS